MSGLVITPAAGDTTVTYFQITGITGGTLYYSGGTAPITNGQFISVASGEAGLEFIPATNSVTSGGFTAQESTTGNSGGLVGTTTTATISITGSRASVYRAITTPPGSRPTARPSAAASTATTTHCPKPRSARA